MSKHVVTTAIACLIGAQSTFAAGTRVGFNDTFAMGRGNAFAATADTPAAIFYNPAGIVQLDGTDTLAGVYAIQFSSRHTAPGGEVTQMDEGFEAMPQFFAAHNDPNSPWAFGLGAYSPFGLVTKWPEDAPFATMATESELLYFRVAPTVAWQVNPRLSVAAGPSLNYASLKLRRAIGVSPGDEFRVDLDDTAAGYHLGLLWQPAPQHSFGVSYHSQTRFKFSGDAEARPYAPEENARLSMPFPEIAIVGYSYRPHPNWNVEVNLDWTNWDRLNTVELRRQTGSDELPFHWNSTFFYGVGATRYLGQGHYLSAGYLYAENAVPSATFSPMVPDSRLHFYSLGFGRKKDGISWNAAYHYGHGPSRNIPEPSPAAGQYETDVHGLAVSLGMSF